MTINKMPVNFQIDTGSSVNILPHKYVTDNNISDTDVILKTWNKNNYKPIGECRVSLKNPKNNKKYNVNFIVCHDEFTQIIGLSASE
jgi:hypothetical protein